MKLTLALIAAAALVALAALAQPAIVPGDLGGRAASNVGVPTPPAAVATPAVSAPTYQLTIARSGSSGGQITVRPVEGGAAASGESCAQATCTVALPRGDYTLAASGDARVVSWGGACPDGQPTCTVLVDRARTVNVRTDRSVKTLTLKKLGEGMGNLLLSGPAGMTCGGTCLYDPPDDLVQSVTLTAEPAHAFAGWGGACMGSEPKCTLPVDQALEATATFR